MSKEISHIKDGNDSRKSTEGLTPVTPGKIRPHNIDEVLHELQEHQASLEMKNRELVDAWTICEESRSRYADLYESAPVGYLTFDEHGVVKEVNIIASRLLGAVKKSLINKPFSPFIAPPSRQVFSGHIQEAFKSRKEESCEIVVKRKDGAAFTAQLQSMRAPVKGTPLVRTVITNITEHKRYEEELQKNYRDLVEHSNSIILKWKPNGEITFFNKFAQSFFGYSEEEIIGKNVMILVPEKDSFGRDLSALTRDIIQKPEHYAVSVNENIRRNGKRAWVRWTNKAIFDDGGNVVEMLVIGNDVTEQKWAEESLKRVNERFRMTLESITDGFVSLDREFRYTYVNEAATRFVGRTRDELLGRRPDEVFPEFPSQAFYRRFMRILEEGKPVHFEEYYGPPLNCWFESHCYPEPEGLTVYFRDITDRKEMEESLQRARDELEQRVRERTRELKKANLRLQEEIVQREKAESELLQAQKMEAIGTLSGGIAHDFNNILAGIIGFTEMVLDDVPPDTPIHRHLELVLKSGIRGRDLVRQILAFSRKTDHEREPVPLSPVVAETLKLLRASLPTTIQIKVNMDAGSDRVFANPSELQQIIMNLVTNAAHSMREKGGNLEVTLANKEIGPGSGVQLAPGPYVEIVIKDAGTGMEEKVMKRIFEPFFTTKGIGKGTGMGLAVVYGIVKGLGGEITVQSAAGKGSTFRVFLPRIEDAACQQATGETPGGMERVLFVDDEELLSELGKGVLEKLGYTVTAATDGQKALKIFSQNPTDYDLVLTDQTMPGITGYELARQLLEIRRDLPIILITGHSDSVSAKKAKEAGIRGFLMKPLSTQELAYAVRHALDEKRLSKREKGSLHPN
ncbi:MAG TPA: PAS domain S-box protein [Syntrophorhabdaceae bacterium]